jgi:hypothetical protein
MLLTNRLTLDGAISYEAICHWKKCIAEYYKVHQPGDTYPALLMTKTVDAIWDY